MTDSGNLWTFGHSASKSKQIMEKIRHCVVTSTRAIIKFPLVFLLIFVYDFCRRHTEYRKIS